MKLLFAAFLLSTGAFATSNYMLEDGTYKAREWPYCDQNIHNVEEGLKISLQEPCRSETINLTYDANSGLYSGVMEGYTKLYFVEVTDDKNYIIYSREVDQKIHFSKSEK